MTELTPRADLCLDLLLPHVPPRWRSRRRLDEGLRQGPRRRLWLKGVSLNRRGDEWPCWANQARANRRCLTCSAESTGRRTGTGSRRPRTQSPVEPRTGRFRSAAVGMIFQSFNLVPSRIAAQNVELPMIFAGLSRTQRRAEAWRSLRSSGARGTSRTSAFATERRRKPAGGHCPGARQSARGAPWPTNRPAIWTVRRPAK